MDGTKKVQRGKRRSNRNLKPPAVDPLKYEFVGRLASFLSSDVEMKYLELAEAVDHVDILERDVLEVEAPSGNYMVHLYSCRVAPLRTEASKKFFCERGVAAWGQKSNNFRWLEEDWGVVYEDRFVEPEELHGQSGRSVNSKY